MNMDQLYQLMMVVQAGGFRKASESMHISQPALSKSIQRLEDLFGVQLVDRLSTGVVPTESGKIVLEWARAVTTSLENTKRHINLSKGFFTGTLKIGADPYFEDFALGPLIGKLVDRHPQIKIEVRVDTWKNLEEFLINQTIDLYMGHVDGTKHPRDIEILSQQREPMIFFCRPGHPLFERDRVETNDIMNYPLAGLVAQNLVKEVIKRVSRDRKQNIKTRHPDLSVQIGNYSTLRKIVMTSNCVGRLPESCIKPFLEQGHLAELPFSTEKFVLEIGVAYLRNRPTAPLIKMMFERILFEELKKERDQKLPHEPWN